MSRSLVGNRMNILRNNGSKTALRVITIMTASFTVSGNFTSVATKMCENWTAFNGWDTRISFEFARALTYLQPVEQKQIQGVPKNVLNS
jgi:hypothetical protein